MNKTEFWICDKCGKKIISAEDGCVEWMSIKDNSIPTGYREENFHIVHRITCINSESSANISDRDLCELTSSDGLMDLLMFLSEENYKNKDEIIEIIKRIHIPGYEQARLHFEDAISGGVFEPNTKPNYYSQYDISQVIKYINSNKE